VDSGEIGGVRSDAVGCPEVEPTVASKLYANDQATRVLIAELEYQGIRKRRGAALQPSFPGGIGSGWPALEPDPEHRALVDQWLEERLRPQAA